MSTICRECEGEKCPDCHVCLCTLITPQFTCGTCDWTWIEETLHGLKKFGYDLPEGQETFVIEIPDRFSTAPPQTFSRVKITIDGETVFDHSNGNGEE